MIAIGVILASILVIVGAVLWVKPSPRERRLAQLRQQALMDGFKVQQRRVPDLSIEGRVNGQETHLTFYRKYCKSNFDQIYNILRTTGESGIHLPVGWIWEENLRLPENKRSPVQHLLSELPESVLGIELAPDYVGVAWDERSKDTYPQIVELLRQIGNL